MAIVKVHTDDNFSDTEHVGSTTLIYQIEKICN